MAQLAKKPRVVVVMPAYNAAKTLRMTYADLPHEHVDLVILVDDASSDETVYPPSKDPSDGSVG